MKSSSVIVAACVCLAGLVGCEDKSPPPMPATRENPQTPLGRSAQTARETAKKITANQEQAASVAEGPGDIAVGGMTFKTPAGWQRVAPAGSMRAAELRVQGAEGEATVVFFSGIQGSMDMNIGRWKGMVKPERGGEPKETTLTVAQSYPARRVSMIGTYTPMAAGGTPAAPLPGTKFVGVIIDGPSGQIQIRLTGPETTVEDAERAFDAMVSGAQSK